MDAEHAQEIADLLNRRNQLTVNHTGQSVLDHHNNYVTRVQDCHMIAAVQVKKVQWYQAELCHLTVHEEYEGKGHGRALATSAEKCAIALGARLIQCTIREGNGDSERLFRAAGYCRGTSFFNPDSGNYVAVWQKALVTRPNPETSADTDYDAAAAGAISPAAGS